MKTKNNVRKQTKVKKKKVVRNFNDYIKSDAMHAAFMNALKIARLSH